MAVYYQQWLQEYLANNSQNSQYFSALTDRDSPKTNLMVRQAWPALPLSYRLECKLKK